MSAIPVILYIVDDDPEVRRALARLLRSAGYTTRSFGSASEFLVSGEARYPSKKNNAKESYPKIASTSTHNTLTSEKKSLYRCKRYYTLGDAGRTASSSLPEYTNGIRSGSSRCGNRGGI